MNVSLDLLLTIQYSINIRTSLLTKIDTEYFSKKKVNEQKGARNFNRNHQL